jgi:hypothetical protein
METAELGDASNEEGCPAGDFPVMLQATRVNPIRIGNKKCRMVESERTTLYHVNELLRTVAKLPGRWLLFENLANASTRGVVVTKGSAIAVI